MNKKMNNKGFSLVELIIVIMIMAILIGVLTPQFVKYVEKSRISRDVQNVQQAKTALEAYVAGNEVASTETISIAVVGGKGATKQKVTVTAPSGADLGGLSLSFDLSSGNWPDKTATFKYGLSDYKWTVDPASITDFKNTSDTTKDMVKVFQ